MKFKTKLIFLILIVVGILWYTTVVSAGNLEEPIKQNDIFDLVQTCSDCTYVELTSVTYPNGTLFEMGKNMTKIGEDYKYKFGNTSELGIYKYNTCGDVMQQATSTRFTTCETISFEVTGNGNESPSGNVVIVFSIAFLIIMFFLLWELIMSVGHFMNLDFDIKDLSFAMGTYFALFGLYWLETLYLGNPGMEVWLLLFIRVGAFTHVIVPMTAFLVSITIGSLKKQKFDVGMKHFRRTKL